MGYVLHVRSAAAHIQAQKVYDVASIPQEELLLRKVRAGLSKVRTFFFTSDIGMKNAARRDQRHQGRTDKVS